METKSICILAHGITFLPCEALAAAAEKIGR